MQDQWYFKTYVILIAFLCVGPFALPLVWFNPNFSRKKKTIISVIVLILTYLLGILLANSIKSLISYYQLLQQQI